MRRRIVLILVCVLAALLSASATTAWLLLREVPRITVIVTSQPPNASVFKGEKALGTAPVELPLARGQELSLHLIRKDFRDAEVELRAADYAMPTIAQRLRLKPPSPPYQRTVEMESAADAEMTIKVQPDSANIFLDGHLLGVAPLAPQRVAPGAHSLRMEHPECFTITENVLIEAGKQLTIERKLESKVAAFYHERMRQEPWIMVHCTELVHHHILRGEFAEAAQALRDGFPGLTVQTPPGFSWPKGPMRIENREFQFLAYFDEMVRFYTKSYYVYPKGDDSILRKTCRELVIEAQQKKIGNQEMLANYLKQFDTYDKDHPPK